MEDPLAPANLTAEVVSATEVRLRWDAVEGAARYDLGRRDNGGPTRSKVVEVLGTSYLDTGLDPGQAYVYDVMSVVVVDGTEYASQWSGTVSVTPLLAAPANLTATAVNSVSVELSWDEVPNATGYLFQWKRGNGRWTEEAAGVTALSRVHPDLHPNSAYAYKVRAFLTAGGATSYSEWGEEVPAMTGAPEVPENLTAMETSATSVKVSWDAVPAADRYNLRRQDMTAPGSQLFEVTGTSYQDGSVMAEREYRYEVQTVVVRPGLTYQSGWSGAVAVTPMVRPPGSVSATAPDAVTVVVTWDAAAGAEGYRLRWRAGRGAWEVDPDDYLVTEYRHDDRDPNTDYSYEVLSYVGTDESGWSDTAEVTTPVLPAPSGVEAAATATAVTVTWDAVEVADAYQVWRQEMAGGTSQVNEVRGTEYEDTGVSLGVEYRYRVLTLLERTGGGPDLGSERDGDGDAVAGGAGGVDGDGGVLVGDRTDLGGVGGGGELRVPVEDGGRGGLERGGGRGDRDQPPAHRAGRGHGV